MAATSESLFEVTDPILSEKDNNDDLDSLPSISTDEIYSDEEDYDDDAQAEWERSLEQVQMLLTMVIVPFVGKYFGRKFAYWSKHISSCPLPRNVCQQRRRRGAVKLKKRRDNQTNLCQQAGDDI